MTLAEYIAAAAKAVDAALDRWVPAEARESGDDPQRDALQPVRGREAHPSVAGDGRGRGGFRRADGIESCACALEMIHTYSLIHDDLPGAG